MAQALFKSWFIDFGPVRAKMAGRAPVGMGAATAFGVTGPRFLRITDIRGWRIDWSAVPSCVTREDEFEKYRIEHGDIFVARTGASTGENVYVVDPPVAAVRDEVAFFQTMKAMVLKSSVERDGRSRTDVETAIRQLVSKAIIADGVIDVFEAAGLKKPDLGILSEEFLAQIRELPQKNLAVELLRKLLGDELKSRRKKNVVQSEAFSEKLDKTIARYRNRAIETVQVIEELLALAKEVKAAKKRGDDLKLSEDELAFYDALGANDSAVAVLGDAVPAQIARELTQTIRNSVTIDWTVKETVRAKLRTLVRRKLRQHGYPPDKTEKAVDTVLQQAELLAANWAA